MQPAKYVLPSYTLIFFVIIYNLLLHFQTYHRPINRYFTVIFMQNQTDCFIFTSVFVIFRIFTHRYMYSKQNPNPLVSYFHNKAIKYFSCDSTHDPVVGKQNTTYFPCLQNLSLYCLLSEKLVLTISSCFYIIFGIQLQDYTFYLYGSITQGAMRFWIRTPFIKTSAGQNIVQFIFILFF